ncbi:MAG: tRNA lysidine(34) synthetase TilS [Planctomycetota bacterium]
MAAADRHGVAGDGFEAVRRYSAARRTAASWRALTGGRDRRDGDRRTLVACSGGVDSSALAIALAAGSGGARSSVELGHVVHDMRDRKEALGDLDSVRALGAALGVDIHQRDVPVRAMGGNLEGAARRGRYEALAEMAVMAACPFIATAHHADDQLETVLMRVIRGAGPRGLAGVMPVRRLETEFGGEPVRVVRPMLSLTREDAVGICEAAGWTWREDASNRDESMVRNAIRAKVVPELKALRADAAERASVTAEICGMAADAIERRARLVLNRATSDPGDSGQALVLDRKTIARTPMAVRCETLRMVLRDFGGSGLDRAGWGVLEPVAGAIGDGRTEPRTFRVGSIVVAVRAHEVRISEVVDG